MEQWVKIKTLEAGLYLVEDTKSMGSLKKPGGPYILFVFKYYIFYLIMGPVVNIYLHFYTLINLDNFSWNMIQNN